MSCLTSLEFLENVTFENILTVIYVILIDNFRITNQGSQARLVIDLLVMLLLGLEHPKAVMIGFIAIRIFL